MGKNEVEKEAIIAEYLVGESSYRKLGIKYGVDFRNVHSWVVKYQGRSPKRTMKLKQKKEEEAPLSNEVKQFLYKLVKRYTSILYAI
jgi:hypothetical protein